MFLTGATAARADIAVSGLRVGLDERAETARDWFPVGTQAVFVTFDYREAAGQRVALDVTAYGGVVVHARSRNLSGSGTETSRLDGADAFRHLAAQLQEAAQSARSSARSAASQEFGVVEYLSGVQAGVVRMGNVVDVMAAVRAPVVSRADLEELRQIERQVGDLVVRAQRAATDQQRKQLAERMAQPLERAVAIAGHIVSLAAQATGVPLPVSGGGWEYVVRVSVNGSPADTTEFVVDGGLVMLPTLSRRAPVHGR